MAEQLQNIDTTQPAATPEVAPAAVAPTPVQPVATSRGGSLLEQLGLTAEGVLATPNIQDTLVKPTRTPSDALDIFTQQEEALGIPGLKTKFQEAQKRRIAGELLAQEEQLTIEGRRKKLGVLRGEQEQAGKKAALDISTLLQGETLAQSALGMAQTTAQQRGKILYDEYQQKVALQLEFPGLDINPLTDDMSKVSSKLKDYKEDQEKKAEKDAYKEALRAIGKSTKGSRKELENRLKKANKSAYEQAQEETSLKLRALRASTIKAEMALRSEKTTDEQLDNLWGSDTVGSEYIGGLDGLTSDMKAMGFF